MENIREIEVQWHPKTEKLYQIPKEGMQYAFVSQDFKQIHQLVWCKDFLQDAIWGHLNQKKVSIYGFTYDPETMLPLYLRRTRLMVANWKDESLGPKLLNNCLPFLHAIEKRLGMRRTELFRCQKVPPRYSTAGVWLLEGSKRWMKSPPMISLYTLLIRAGMTHHPGKMPVMTLRHLADGTVRPYFGGEGFKGADDNENISTSLSRFKHLLKTGDRKIFHRKMRENYPSTIQTNKLHNSYGFVGFAKNYTEEDFPYWHRQEVKS